MLPKSLSKISLVSAGNIFNAILGFTFLSAVARNLSVEDFGRYALLTSILVSVSKIIDFGTNSYFVAKSITYEKNITNTFISLKFVLFLITVPIGLFALVFLNLATPIVLITFLAGLVFYGINITFFAFFQKKEQFTKAVLLNTLPASVKGIAAALIFIGLAGLTYEQAFMIFSFAMSASLALGLYIREDLSKISVSWSGAVEFFTASAYAGISQVITNGWPAIANTVAKITGSFAEVGIFSLADKIANIFSLISISIFTVLLPRNAVRKKERLGYDLRETFFLSVGILVMSVVAMGAAGIFLGTFFGDKFSGAAVLVNILILASAITAIHVFIENFFYIEEKTKHLLGITSTKLAVFLILAVILVPILSLVGIAYAQLIAALYALTLTIFLVRRNKTN